MMIPRPLWPEHRRLHCHLQLSPLFSVTSYSLFELCLDEHHCTLASLLCLGASHQKLFDMMRKQREVENWSKTHSSPLEYSKLALINFASRHKNADNPPLSLLHRTIQPADSTKYLGVIVDRHLSCHRHEMHSNKLTRRVTCVVEFALSVQIVSW